MPTAPAKRVIWVVDDSPLDAERTRRVLSAECIVEVFPDGSAALERLAAASVEPDVLVLDWVMPGVTGVDVCRFLRSAEGGYPAVGILLLTTHSDTDQIVEGLSAGANDYLAKPYADAELLARVRSLLRARELLERAEQAEAVSLELLQMMPDPLIAIDETHTIRFCNAAATAALRAQDVHVGMPLSALVPDLERRLQNQNAAETFHLPDIKIGELLFSPTLRSVTGNPMFSTILSLRDVTESRRLDARRLDFYSIIAHDLRSPLNTLTLRTQLILAGRHGVLPAALTSDLQKTDSNLKSLVEMINDFLEIASLDNVRYELRNDDVDIRALLADTVENLRPQLEGQRLSWTPDSCEPVFVVGDARRLQQVLTNLIGNAIKFTKALGSITTRVTPIGSEVEVSVIDNGTGIAADKLATLFDRYTRATDKQDTTPGTGLGLMIVREIVEAHGGTVGVESDVGVGSRFWVRIPRASTTR